MAGITFDADIKKIVDDIAEQQINKPIRMASIAATDEAIDDSPVLTGRFKGNWQAVINSTPDTFKSDASDADGSATAGAAESIINKFNIEDGDDFIYIFNNVAVDEGGEGLTYYAETVSYDNSGARARSILDAAELSFLEKFDSLNG